MIAILPFPFPVFFIVALAFGLFSLIYLIIAASVIYHLRAFTLPGHAAGSYIFSAVFAAASCLLWLAGLMFLLRIPR